MIGRFLGVSLLTVGLLTPAALVAQDAPAPLTKGKAAKLRRVPLTPPASKEFSEDVAAQVLRIIRDGLQNHSANLVLAAFDHERLPNFLTFEDEIHSYFNQNDSIRCYFRILQTSTEGDRGIVLAEWQIESTRPGGLPQRRDSQVRFELAAGKNGWQIVGFAPRNFLQ
jgi:hypothetical protein